jgi:hypothetical protein
VRLADDHGFELLLMHNLLDISGHGARQPVVCGDSEVGTLEVLLFNGEIYYFHCAAHDSDTAFLAERLPSLADTLGRALVGCRAGPGVAEAVAAADKTRLQGADRSFSAHAWLSVRGGRQDVALRRRARSCAGAGSSRCKAGSSGSGQAREYPRQSDRRRGRTHRRAQLADMKSR